MKPHILHARHYWQQRVQPGNTVIDATVGSGQDLCYLATLLQGKGRLVGYDIQKEALAQTEKRMALLSPLERRPIFLKHQSHRHFEEKEAHLIVYNLGYLPGGNKRLTTLTETTLESVASGLKILAVGGALSIMCYPGHAEGSREESALLQLTRTLLTSQWLACHHRWLNRSSAPSLLWIERLEQEP